VYDDEEEEG
jgi:hypothetical protein